MEKSSFFNSVMTGNRPDRVYLAEDFARYFNSFIGNGVFPNPSTSLQVMANDDMTVTLKAGKGWINGYFYVNTDDLVIPIEMADGLRHRIDRIVLRLDLNNRWVKTAVKKGKLDTNPIPPSLQRGDNIYELGIAEVRVGKGDISISQSQIKDTRASSELCGWVTGVVDQVDTETLFNQYESWYKDTTGKAEADLTDLKEQFKKDLDEFTDNYTDWFTSFTGESEKEFNEWFDSIKDVLDENVATKLYEEIEKQKLINDTQDEQITELSKVVVEAGNSMTQSIQELRDGKAEKSDISRSSTIVIANYDSHDNSKNGADIVINKGENASTKINNAIQSLKNTGGEIKLMEGTYNIKSTINMGENIILSGLGNITILHITNNINGIETNNVSNWCSIRNLKIKGTGAGQTSYKAVTLRKNSTLEKCSIDSFQGYGAYLYDSAEIKGSWFDDFKQEVVRTYGSENGIYSCVFTNAQFAYTIYAFEGELTVKNSILKNIRTITSFKGKNILMDNVISTTRGVDLRYNDIMTNCLVKGLTSEPAVQLDENFKGLVTHNTIQGMLTDKGTGTVEYNTII